MSIFLNSRLFWQVLNYIRSVLRVLECTAMFPDVVTERLKARHKHRSIDHKNTTMAEKHLVFLVAEGKDCPFKSEKYRNKCI